MITAVVFVPWDPNSARIEWISDAEETMCGACVAACPFREDGVCAAFAAGSVEVTVDKYGVAAAARCHLTSQFVTNTGAGTAHPGTLHSDSQLSRGGGRGAPE